jgi:hypothetical protein
MKELFGSSQNSLGTTGFDVGCSKVQNGIPTCVCRRPSRVIPRSITPDLAKKMHEVVVIAALQNNLHPAFQLGVWHG